MNFLLHQRTQERKRTPASSDTTKLEKLIIAMFGKEEEVRGKIIQVKRCHCCFCQTLSRLNFAKIEQRSKLLVDAVKQMRQENDVSLKVLQDKLEVMNNSSQKKVVTHRFEPTSKYILFSLVAWLYPLSSPFGAISPNGESTKIGRRLT